VTTSAGAAPLRESALPLPLVRRGKVREVYAVGDDRVLVVASDRVSAFDVVMGEPVPYKGAVLTQLTAWWLRRLEAELAGEVAHHMLSADADEIVAQVPALRRTATCSSAGPCSACAPRSTRWSAWCAGYLSGSAWKEYRTAAPSPASRCRPGSRRAPVSTRRSSARRPRRRPGTTRTSRWRASPTLLGADVAAELERLSRLVYGLGGDWAAERGIIVADTKFEFGARDGACCSSTRCSRPTARASGRRRVRARRGAAELRQAAAARLARRRARRALERRGAAAALPAEVVRATSARYLEAYERLTGAPARPRRAPGRRRRRAPTRP
jgi:phosphoribosylaminoimidazole-succinocarboxamide synthase